MIKNLSLLILFIFIGNEIHAQSVVKGTVKNLQGQIQPNVEVSTEDGQSFAFTNEKGVYSLILEKGIYTITFKGEQGNVIKKLTIKDDNKEYRLDVVLLEDTNTEKIGEVQVIGRKIKKGSEAEALLLQKKAVTLKEAISSQELSQKGVSNAAGAVSKIVGISKQESTGNVYVRGLGDRYLNTTLNGLSLPSNQIDKKNINLSLFSSDIINNVSVAKSYSSEFYGDFSGGNIDIASKEYTGKGWLIVPSPSFGINSRTMGKGSEFVQPEGTGIFGFYKYYSKSPYETVLQQGVDPISSRGIAPVNLKGNLQLANAFVFKNNSRLSFFLTGSFNSDYQYREGPEEQLLSGSIIEKNFPNTKRYIYNATTTALGNLTYTLNKNHKISYHSLFVNDAVNQVGYYGTQGKGESKEDNGKGYYLMNTQLNQNLLLVNQLTGYHAFENGKFKVDWGIGLNSVRAREPDRKRITITNYDYILHSKDDPASYADLSTYPSFYQDNASPYDDQRYFQNIKDREYNSRLNVSYQPSKYITWNIGYDGKERKRNFDDYRFGYDYLSRLLVNHPEINPKHLNPFFKADNIQKGIIKIKTLRFDNELPENTFEAKQTIQGLYVSPEIKLTEKLLIVPGLRLEFINQSIIWDVANMSSIIPKGSLDKQETVYLPSINLKYALNKKTNMRFAFSKTVSLPEFKEIAPFVYTGVTSEITGNTDLLGRTTGVNNYKNVSEKSYSDIYNFDLKYEWFLGNGELLSLALFTKRINHPVNQAIVDGATGTRGYFRTGEYAYASGIEFEMRKNILKTQINKPLLSLGMNAAYTKTRQKLYDKIEGTLTTSFGKKEEDKLQGASPFIINGYIRVHPIHSENIQSNLNLVGNYFSDRIFTLASLEYGNDIEKGVATVDLIWRNTLYKKLEVNFAAKNILDPNIEIIRKVNDKENITLSKYKRGITLGIELKYFF